MADFSITALLRSVDQLGQNYVATAYQALSSALTAGGAASVAGLVLTLYVIFWGIGIWQGTATGGPADHAFRLFRAFLIYALATSWNDFQTLAYQFMNDGPSAIGNALLSAVTTANNTGTSQNLTSVNGVQRPGIHLHIQSARDQSARAQWARTLRAAAGRAASEWGRITPCPRRMTTALSN